MAPYIPYKKGGENEWRKHHQSAICRDIWLYDQASNQHRKISTFKGEDRQPVTLETLGQQVGIITNANPTIQVLVEGDTEAGWGAMVNLITTLQAAGVANPNFITQPLGSI